MSYTLEDILITFAYIIIIGGGYALYSMVDEMIEQLCKKISNLTQENQELTKETYELKRERIETECDDNGSSEVILDDRTTVLLKDNAKLSTMCELLRKEIDDLKNPAKLSRNNTYAYPTSGNIGY
jgi:cell division protein FtsB